MPKKTVFLILGILLTSISFSCEANKLTQAQMKEIYNKESAPVSASANAETKVSVRRILKPNVSTKTAGSNSQPKDNSMPVQTGMKTLPAQQNSTIQSKSKISAIAKPQVKSKPDAITNPKVEQAPVPKETLKHKSVKIKKGKGLEVKKSKPEVKSSDSSWKIKVSQKNLRILGFSNEVPTGKITAVTKEALIAFQKKHKLTAKGDLNDETYNKLNWEAFAKTGIKNIKGSDVVAKAAKYKGVPYVFGGTTPKGFDCSGYVQYIFKELGGKLTRTADTQAEEGIFVNQKQLKPGDLVFFTTYEPGASHVGIYAGNGQFWNASSSRGVILYKLNDDYWRTRYYGARRVLISNGEIN